MSDYEAGFNHALIGIPFYSRNEGRRNMVEYARGYLDGKPDPEFQDWMKVWKENEILAQKFAGENVGLPKANNWSDHVGHKINCAHYVGVKISIECETCGVEITAAIRREK